MRITNSDITRCRLVEFGNVNTTYPNGVGERVLYIQLESHWYADHELRHHTMQTCGIWECEYNVSAWCWCVCIELKRTQGFNMTHRIVRRLVEVLRVSSTYHELTDTCVTISDSMTILCVQTNGIAARLIYIVLHELTESR